MFHQSLNAPSAPTQIEAGLGARVPGRARTKVVAYAQIPSTGRIRSPKSSQPYGGASGGTRQGECGGVAHVAHVLHQIRNNFV